MGEGGLFVDTPLQGRTCGGGMLVGVCLLILEYDTVLVLS